jgi:hypothetical protein
MTMRAIYHKRVFHPAGLVSAVVALLLLATPLAAGAALLVPMDFSQTDHLKAYGLAYWCLEQGQSVEWLLNYRGGSFLLNAVPENEREARIRGISTEEISGSGLAAMYSEIEQNNMETVLLEKVPKIAVYVPPNVQPCIMRTSRASMASSTPASGTPSGTRTSKSCMRERQGRPDSSPSQSTRRPWRARSRST